MSHTASGARQPKLRTARMPVVVAILACCISACKHESNHESWAAWSPEAQAASLDTVRPPSPRSGSSEPELPRVLLDTRYVRPIGKVRLVKRGDDLQAAIDAAQPGDELQLEAGGTFVGNFILPEKKGAGWIVIRSAAGDSELPHEGTRITPAYSARLPKLVSPNGEPALRTAPAAHHYRIVALEATTSPSVVESFAIVALGERSAAQSSLERVPHDLVLDRVYVHGQPTLNLRRCVALNSASTALIDSYLSECHDKRFDSQAAAGWNGPGPFKIVDNYLEGAGENVAFGGGDPTIPGLTPSDIEIRRNHFARPVAWKGVWLVKNILEFKNAQRVLIEGNVFENNWADGQDGFAMVWKSVNQDGGAPWSVLRDVTFRRNIVRNSGAAVNLAAQPERFPAVPASRVKIVDNVFENINTGSFTSHGRLFQLLGGPADVTIEHNTALQTDAATSNAAVMIDNSARKLARFVFRDNIVTRGQYGVFGQDAGEGKEALGAHAEPGWIFSGNIIIGAPMAQYPANNFFPRSVAEVGFVNAAAGDLHLAAASPFKRHATDGRDPGADIDAVLAATRDVVRPPASLQSAAASRR